MFLLNLKFNKKYIKTIENQHIVVYNMRRRERIFILLYISSIHALLGRLRNKMGGADYVKRRSPKRRR